MSRRLLLWLLASVALSSTALGGSAGAEGLAVFRLDPLGVEPEIVTRLDGLLRMELGRLADATLPSARRIALVLARDAELQNCTGEVGCLTKIGRALGVGRIISGNVGGLAGEYVLNLKMLDVAQAREVRKIQESMSGRPDQLIEAVRVAAYRLVAPERLRGTLEVLANVAGASVLLDGTPLGQTPLAPQHGLEVGQHTLRVHKDGYTDVVQEVKVRLQKTARVVVTLQAPPARRRQRERRVVVPWYTRWWFWTAVGVVAVGAGAALGYAVSGSPAIDCGADAARCGL